jgi:ATP-dependent helicase/nuclease subunit A
MYGKAEQERLLYVATTRAKQFLVVSWYPSKPGKGAWTDLYPYLSAAPELEAPKEEDSVATRRHITAKEFETAKVAILNRIESKRRHSYERQTVTGIAVSQAPSPTLAHGDEGGMAWGRIIHRALEVLLRKEGIGLQAMISSLLKEEGRPLSEQDAVATAVQAVLSSDFWVRVKKSQTALVEVPFASRIEGPTPGIVAGTIDLVFKEADGWVIVDYKSDRVGGVIDDLVARYKPQVLIYKDFLEKITGEAVWEAGIYFTALNRWVAV